MKNVRSSTQRSTFRPSRRPLIAEIGLFASLSIVTGISAIVTKQLVTESGSPALAAVTERVTERQPAGHPADVAAGRLVAAESDDAALAELYIDGLPAWGTPADPQPADAAPAPAAAAPDSAAADPLAGTADASLRWFNGRPVRPARTMTMIVTAYSPDARSCGDSADGITASLHHVETNAHRLVAADKRVLPLGSMISVPGYDAGRIVPVLDVGGAIKGNRLDVLFPTHAQARAWGVRKVQVTLWQYADGAAPPNWRHLRDSKR